MNSRFQDIMATLKLQKDVVKHGDMPKSAPLVGAAKATLGDVTLIQAPAIARANRVDVPRSRGLDPWQLRASRVLDIVGSLLLIIALLPVLIVLSIVTFITTSGSPIFAHTRIGRDGTKFKCYKFRTMYVDAEAMLQKLIANDPVLRRQWEAEHKLQDDPRVTTIGKFLRVTSLDELPQLFNVLKGEMSLVGPRPIVEQELERYGRYSTSYLALKPGLTGLWQVSGRSGTTYRRRVATDHIYALNKCLFLDIRIMLATVPAVLQQKGAC